MHPLLTDLAIAALVGAIEIVCIGAVIAFAILVV